MDKIIPEIIPQTFGKEVYENHLGGFFYDGDPATYYPEMWEYLVNVFKIKSVLDIGCGRGFSTKFFKSLNCDVIGVDGSEKIKEMSLVPESFVLNDYEKGSAINDGRTFDLCWSCEFVEHVYEQYIPNFMNDFKKCRYVAMTFAYVGQTGWHHVNENTQEYWIDVFKKNDFTFYPEITDVLKQKTKMEGITSHFHHRGLFFVNNLL